MSDATFALIYGLSVVTAFCLHSFGGWRVASSLIVATTLSLALWLSIALAKGARLNDPGLEFGLLTNGLFCLGFAIAGLFVSAIVSEV